MSVIHIRGRGKAISIGKTTSKLRHFLSRRESSICPITKVRRYVLSDWDFDKVQAMLRRRKMLVNATLPERALATLFWPAFPGDFIHNPDGPFRYYHPSSKQLRRARYWWRQMHRPKYKNL